MRAAGATEAEKGALQCAGAEMGHGVCLPSLGIPVLPLAGAPRDSAV